MVLKWRYQELLTGRWSKIAIVKSGKARVFPVNSNLDGRFILHSNGSLEIRSLHHDDETLYQCIVMQRGDREAHLIELNVACGHTTVTKREVCIEEDVVLDCDAKHRTNPRKLKQVTWKKESDGKQGSSFSKVAALYDDVTTDANDGFSIHSNGALLVRKGREEGNMTYKCDVSRTDGNKDETHLVHVKSIKCRNETQKPVKRNIGSVSMTTEGASVIITQKTIVCGGVLNNSVGTFQSPNFPSAYPANSHCKWTISLPQDYAAINITLDHLNLEPEKRCRYDYLAVYDRLDNQVGCRHCGLYGKTIIFQVRGRTAVVVFKSDDSVQKTGFKVSYRGV
ncbi:signal peptide, CUB and EGF-like domain-containing protein 3 isoform X2 [Actinia tenebrosa]|nr:signal peptide, CUB and EGF-like domain-containing protein 3 isoform X2 [Actinia tenebrosa]